MHWLNVSFLADWFFMNGQAMSYAKLAGLQPIYGLCKFSPQNITFLYIFSFIYIYYNSIWNYHSSLILFEFSCLWYKLNFLFIYLFLNFLSPWIYYPPNWNSSRGFVTNTFKFWFTTVHHFSKCVALVLQGRLWFCAIIYLCHIWVITSACCWSGCLGLSLGL